MDRVALKIEVREQVKGNRWNLLKPVIIAGAIGYVLNMILSEILPRLLIGSWIPFSSGGEIIITLILTLLIAGTISVAVTAPLQMGVNMYYSEYSKENFADINTIFKPLKYTIKIFVITVFVAFLCSIVSLILLVLCISIGFMGSETDIGLLFTLMMLGMIPGIILSYAFAIIPYVYMKHPELGVMDMVSTSWKMMKGHKFEYFVLELSFIGWMISSVFTCYILFIWLMPYYRMTIVRYFDQIDAEYFGTAESDETIIDIDANTEEITTTETVVKEESVIDVDLSEDDKSE